MNEIQQAGRQSKLSTVFHCICRHPFTGNWEPICGVYRRGAKDPMPLDERQLAHKVREIDRCSRTECQRLFDAADEKHRSKS